ncbi:MAG: trypsin-like peptidase domain-containing protein [Campylobacterota bacterium]|nr:trypsin-like peptidase domain-containing protein [Campylobacterota bacterium]
MKHLILLLFLLTSVFASYNENKTKEAIVKIYSVHKKYNYLEPWNTSIHRSSGSGSIISGNRILTNAHVVANTTFIEVKHFGETKRYIAKVLAVSHQVDLALLSVEDATFFKGITPIEIDSLPTMRQKISIYGFPAGGSALSISDGIVSRIEHFRYKHSGEPFLAIQVDAAINPGNSGGPAISEGKIVGVVMQNIPRAQNIGYLVPTTIIKHFLEDIKDGKTDGFASLGVVTQNLENAAIQKYYGVRGKENGQLITYITYNEKHHGLKVGDIITAIDGHDIENDGTVEFRKNEFTEYKYYIDQHQMGEEVELDIVRNSKKITLPIKLTNTVNELLLVKILQYDKMPTYYIYGGYLFSPLTNNLLSQSKGIPMRLKMFTRQWPSKEKQDIVVLIKVLADDSNRGNHHMRFWPIEKVDGIPIHSFTQFTKLMKNSKNEFITLEDDDGYQVVIDTNASKTQQAKLLKRYNIPAAYSEDCLNAD